MAYFVNDQNTVSMQQESGTYANASGSQIWLGLVQSHEIEENLNTEQVRYVGTASRNVDRFDNKAKDYTGTISYFPQDWRMLIYALGSNIDSGSAAPQVPFTHVASEINSDDNNKFTSGTKNPFMSFTIEDHHDNAVAAGRLGRTLNGCVLDELSLSWTEGDFITMDASYIAQSLAYSKSAAVTAVTASTLRPFMFSDVKVHIASGNVIAGVKDGTLTINNNLVARHYATGSEEIELPIPTNREYELSLTLDASSEETDTFYGNYFLSGTSFNTFLEITAADAGAGSRSCFIVMSGCRVTEMSNPTGLDETAEQSITIAAAGPVVATVKDAILIYNPWLV